MAGELVPSSRVREADWYGAALAGFGGRVECVIPRGYSAYARILHSTQGEAGARVRWADVAAWSGAVLHPLAQFGAIAGRWEYDEDAATGWPGRNPPDGSLDRQQLETLCECLSPHTTTPEHCWLTVWDGYGNLPRRWELTAPTVRQPQRAYYLFARSLPGVVEFAAEVAAVGWDEDPLPSSIGFFGASAADPEDLPSAESLPAWFQSPNQWWPVDRAWCVATEIDFDSTLVAGSEALVDAITRHPELEAFRVQPTDDLTFAGDEVNPAPPPPDN